MEELDASIRIGRCCVSSFSAINEDIDEFIQKKKHEASMKKGCDRKLCYASNASSFLFDVHFFEN
jgi:hypothetical protein